MATLYDSIGIDYAQARRPDPRFATLIDAALGDAVTVVNVGAGAGSYEPAHRQVTAVEPSAEMIRQRPAGAAPVVQASAERLPFADDHFDAAMAVLTVHHWSDKAAGLAELRRVSRGPVVILTYDPAFRGFWLADYFPELVTLDDQQMPPMSDYAAVLGAVSIHAMPVPHDCADGFLCAYWRRPHAYLDPRVRAGMSSFQRIAGVAAGLERLESDLADGSWHARYGSLMALEALDLGYRLVTTI